MSVKEKKIGEFLLERKFISAEQFEQVLELQRPQPEKKFGEIALELHYIDYNAINQYLIYIHTEE
jgi:hypothetical protein